LDNKSAADVAASLADALESFTGSSAASIDVSDVIMDALMRQATNAGNK
jgi:hypothetical protein